MTIDIRNEIHAVRSTIDAIIETAMNQCQDGVREIVKANAHETPEEQAALEIKVSMFLIKEAKRISSTGYMTDSAEGFISAQIGKKLTWAAAEPGSMILTAIYG